MFYSSNYTIVAINLSSVSTRRGFSPLPHIKSPVQPAQGVDSPLMGTVIRWCTLGALGKRHFHCLHRLPRNLDGIHDATSSHEYCTTSVPISTPPCKTREVAMLHDPWGHARSHDARSVGCHTITPPMSCGHDSAGKSLQVHMPNPV